MSSYIFSTFVLLTYKHTVQDEKLSV